METMHCRIDTPATYLVLTCEHGVDIGLNEVESGSQGMMRLSTPSTGIRRLGAFVVQQMQNRILIYCRNTSNTLEINFRNPQRPDVMPWPENVTLEIVSGGASKGKREAKAVTVLQVRKDVLQLETADTKKDNPPAPGPAETVKGPQGTKGTPASTEQAKTIEELRKQVADLEKQVAMLDTRNQTLDAALKGAVSQEQAKADSLTQEEADLVAALSDLKARSASMKEENLKKSEECKALKQSVSMLGDALEVTRREKEKLDQELASTKQAAQAMEQYITKRRKTLQAQQGILEMDPETLKKAVEDDLRHLQTDQVASEFLSSDSVLYSDTVAGFLGKAEENLKLADEQLSKLIHLREAIDLRILETIQAGDGKMDVLKEAGYGIAASDQANHDKAAAGD